MKLWQTTHQRQQHSPPRMSMRRGASFSSLSFLLSNFLLLRGDHKSTASAFSWVSNEKIPLDPNNGIKSAYTNDPVVVKPMPHQPSEQENMPYEFWQENKPFAHVHGTEPEHPDLRHQHFGRNYENFDAPGTGLNVRSIDNLTGKPYKHIFKTSTSPSPNNDEESAFPLPDDLPQSQPKPQLPDRFEEIQKGSPRGPPGTNSPAEFPIQSTPQSVRPIPPTSHQKKTMPEVPPNTSGEAEGELPRNALPEFRWNNQNSPKEFDAYEDVPEIRPNSLPKQPASGLNKAPTAITIAPPRLFPFVSTQKVQSAIQQQQQLMGKNKKKVKGFIVSREQENAPRVEGQQSALVVGEVATKGVKPESYAQKVPAPYKTTPIVNSYQQPPTGYNYKLGPSYAGAGANYAGSTQTRCQSSCGANCPPSNCDNNSGCCCCSNCGGNGCPNGGGSSSCCCTGGNGGGSCCPGANASLCTLRLVVVCCPPNQQQNCCGCRLLTQRTRLIFMQRRVKRQMSYNAGENVQRQKFLSHSRGSRH